MFDLTNKNFENKGMKVSKIVVGFFQVNCYIVQDKGSCIIIDPGDNAHEIISMINKLRCAPEMIIATHAHFDHIMAVKPLKEFFSVPFLLHADDVPILQKQEEFVRSVWGLKIPELVKEADMFLKDGESVGTLTVSHTPGHSPGSISLLGEGFAIVGDTIFRESVGRTDLPGGDPIKLRESIEKLLNLPDDTILYPGHGPETTVGHEKKFNPFL